MNILLIAGGWSSEREVSLKGADNIEAALLELGHKVTRLDLLARFPALVETALRHDFVFINLHGAPGEDGLVQAMLDAIHIPYQGSGAAASFLALNKAAAKQLFAKAGLKTAPWQIAPPTRESGWQLTLPYPVFVKSNTGGSSLRLGKAANGEELNRLLRDIHAHDETALIENALQGQEITCGILGDQALPPILIEPVCGEFFDFQSKYAQNGAREICPAPISPELTRKVQDLALQAHHALGLYGYSRADFILDANGEFTILEVNTLPGMTSTSLLPQEAAQVGISFTQLIGRLIELGLRRPCGV